MRGFSSLGVKNEGFFDVWGSRRGLLQGHISRKVVWDAWWKVLFTVDKSWFPTGSEI